MNSDSIEGKILQSLEGLRGDLDPGRRAEAMAAMAAARPVPPRPWARHAALAMAAGVVLVGLGFVPIPMGRTKGLLDRAMAAASNATTVHITSRRWIGSERTMQEMQEWLSDDFHRVEARENGEWVPHRFVKDGWQTTFFVENGSVKSALTMYDPCFLHPAPLPDRAQFMRQFDLMRWVANWHKYPAPELSVEEHLERSLWGGEVAVVEATARIVNAEQVPLLVGYAAGDQALFRAEIDPGTNALLSQREYRIRNGQKELVRELSYEWNVEIPDELRQFQMPAGTKLERNSWWETRAGETLAQDSTPVWKVTLHSIRRGSPGRSSAIRQP